MDSIQIIYISIIIVLLFLVVVLVYLVCKKYNKENDSFEVSIIKNENNDENSEVNKESKLILSSMEYKPYEIKKNDLLIPLDTDGNNSLSANLATLDAIIPNGAVVTQNVSAVKSATELAKNAFKSDIDPSLLDKSKEVANALRGSSHSGKEFVQNANWTSVSNDVKKLSTVNMVNAAFGIANVVVGQHNMTIIANELKNVKGEIKAVYNKLDAKEQGEFITSISEIDKRIANINEIIENDELREECINDCNNLMIKCKDLFNTPANEIEIFIKQNNSVTEYNKYLEISKQVEEKKERMKTALFLIKNLCDLDYSLHMGNKSKKFSYTDYNQFKTIYERIFNEKIKWNKKYVKEFNIELNKGQRSRKKFDLYKINIFDKNRKIHKMTDNEVTFVEAQIETESELENKIIPYDEKLQIIYKDGKHYLLKSNKDKKEKKTKRVEKIKGALCDGSLFITLQNIIICNN